jgi:hypothetical protein
MRASTVDMRRVGVWGGSPKHFLVRLGTILKDKNASPLDLSMLEKAAVPTVIYINNIIVCD